MNKIAVQMLCGKNEEPFLEAAIRSVQWADYFTIVNTAPESEFGEQNTATILRLEEELDLDLRYVDYEPPQDEFFSAARNACLGLTGPDDYVFIVDADDVHYPIWEEQLKSYLYEELADSVTAHYYHLTLYKDIFHFSAPREIVYKNYEGTEWTKGVHEQLLNQKRWPVVSSYHYVHYGYIKPQTQVFERWKFYSDIEGDFNHYEGQDPHNIISDRIGVCKPLPVQHPPAVEQLLESYPSCPEGALKENWETVPVEKVGLVLITYNDAENLKISLESLKATHPYPEFEVLVLDMGSRDSSLEVVDSFSSSINMQVFETGQLLPLADTLNFGFNHFRQRHDIQYIGWIHPDMRFHNPDWLYCLWQELQDHPKIGKISAANSRDPIPEALIPGHEQCYIVRKDIVNKVGLFDEQYVGIGGYEDWDYNKRILNHDGYKVMISPRAQVFHTGMATRSRRDTTTEQICNARYYTEKWGSNAAPV